MNGVADLLGFAVVGMVVGIGAACAGLVNICSGTLFVARMDFGLCCFLEDIHNFVDGLKAQNISYWLAECSLVWTNYNVLWLVNLCSAAQHMELV